MKETINIEKASYKEIENFASENLIRRKNKLFYRQLNLQVRTTRTPAELGDSDKEWKELKLLLYMIQMKMFRLHQFKAVGNENDIKGLYKLKTTESNKGSGDKIHD